MTATALDLFCGAGGSSTGLAGAGVKVVLAANHWQLAVDTHQLNHPDTDHDCADLSAVDPHRYPATDLLWASPECTNHSVAKGVRRPNGQLALFGGDRPDPGAVRSRATMWDVVRFTEAMADRRRPYRAVVVENVVDAARWTLWPAWVAAMETLGYAHQVVWLNSAFAHGNDYTGAPQYRDRIYAVFWQAGATPPDLDVHPPAWCPTCQTTVDAVQVWKHPYQRWGRYRAQYTYHCPRPRHGHVEPFALPAATAIDWTDPGNPVGDRRRPLAPATRARIAAGLARYGQTALITPADGTWNDTATPTSQPMRTRTAHDTEALACPPLLVPVEARPGLRPRPADEPHRTQTGRLETSLVTTHDGSAVPFVTMLRRNTTPTSTGEPLDTVVAAGNHHGLTVPPGALLMPYYGTGVARPVDRPAGTVTTRDRHALVVRQPAQVTDDDVDSCRFRMLRPAEVGAAMAFPDGYRTLGAKRDQVRMYGNAVTPPAARLLAERLLTALETS